MSMATPEATPPTIPARSTPSLNEGGSSQCANKSAAATPARDRTQMAAGPVILGSGRPDVNGNLSDRITASPLLDHEPF
jgi:hypothetical protein